MSKYRSVALLAVVVSTVAFSANVLAQEKTRAEVRQELIDAENNGLNFVTNTSYPAISPIYEQQAARLKQLHESSGPESSGTSAAGQKAPDSTDGGLKEGMAVAPK
jgi:hypothetical protein